MNNLINMKKARRAYASIHTYFVSVVDHEGVETGKTRLRRIGAPSFRAWARTHFSSPETVGKLLLIVRSGEGARVRRAGGVS